MLLQLYQPITVKLGNFDCRAVLCLVVSLAKGQNFGRTVVRYGGSTEKKTNGLGLNIFVAKLSIPYSSQEMMYNPPKYDRYFSKNELTYIKTTKEFLTLIVFKTNFQIC